MRSKRAAGGRQQPFTFRSGGDHPDSDDGFQRGGTDAHGGFHEDYVSEP